jgi:hypothetical protein
MTKMKHLNEDHHYLSMFALGLTLRLRLANVIAIFLIGWDIGLSIAKGPITWVGVFLCLGQVVIPVNCEVHQNKMTK